MDAVFDFQKFLKENYIYQRGFDLRELQSAPVPVSIGEGHCFEITGSDGRVKHYETRAEKGSSGKRLVVFRFTTLRGISFNATHYYCKVVATINNVDVENGGWAGGYLGGHKIPHEYESMEFDLGNMVPYQKLNEKENMSFFGPSINWERYADENGLVQNAGFEDNNALHELAHRVAEALFPSNEWEVEIEDYTEE